jgi:exodeoxyribonuclease VIII
VDGDTLAWWLKQSDDARLPIANQTGKYTDMMQGFHDWVRKLGKVDGVWGNGATFDNVILGEGFRRINMSQPWPFWADKCYRTIKSLPIAKSVPLQRTGVHHNALDDAKSQAQHLIDINSAIGGGVL